MAVIEITKENFEKEVLNSDKAVLLDFWAPWCGPCRMLSPIVDEVAEENPHIKVGKINVDEEEELAVKFDVMSIPSLFVMKNGTINIDNCNFEDNEANGKGIIFLHITLIGVGVNLIITPFYQLHNKVT